MRLGNENLDAWHKLEAVRGAFNSTGLAMTHFLILCSRDLRPGKEKPEPL